MQFFFDKNGFSFASFATCFHKREFFDVFCKWLYVYPIHCHAVFTAFTLRILKDHIKAIDTRGYSMVLNVPESSEKTNGTDHHFLIHHEYELTFEKR